jgi:hypothetical protein
LVANGRSHFLDSRTSALNLVTRDDWTRERQRRGACTWLRTDPPGSACHWAVALAISDGEIQEPDQAKKRVNDRRREGSPGSVQSRLLQLDAISGDTRRRPATVELRLTSDESLVRTQVRPPGKQPAGTGWCGRRCTRGCASMPKTGWAGWRTGRGGQSVDEADRMGGGIARA